MSFWSTPSVKSATPSLWQMSGLATLEPQFLRREEPEELPNPISETQIIRLRPEHHTIFANFLELYYGGGDWNLRCQNWIRRYTDDPNVIILCLVHEYDVERGGEIFASIMSVPLTDGITAMSHGMRKRNVRVIEGLCVRDKLRSKGIAGVMINRMDRFTHHMFGPTVHLWAREQAYSTGLLPTSALNTYEYGYIRCNEARPRIMCTKMDWLQFSALWSASCFSWLQDGPAIVAELPTNRRGDLTVWLGYRYSAGQDVAVIANTQRYVNDQPIYEVVWCGSIKQGLLTPANKWDNYDTLLESIASKHSGILFATSEYIKLWSYPWTNGTSGYHTWYIYNYLPPAFGKCKLHVIREEV